MHLGEFSRSKQYKGAQRCEYKIQHRGPFSESYLEFLPPQQSVTIDQDMTRRDSRTGIPSMLIVLLRQFLNTN